MLVGFIVRGSGMALIKRPDNGLYLGVGKAVAPLRSVVHGRP